MMEITIAPDRPGHATRINLDWFDSAGVLQRTPVDLTVAEAGDLRTLTVRVNGRTVHTCTGGERAPATDRQLEAIEIGDYVAATKWSDGDGGDPWGVGFYAGSKGPQHFVIDSTGKRIYRSGYRRVKKISPEIGSWLLEHRDEIEDSGRSIWDLIEQAPRG